MIHMIHIMQMKTWMGQSIRIRKIRDPKILHSVRLLLCDIILSEKILEMKNRLAASKILELREVGSGAGGSQV